MRGGRIIASAVAVLALGAGLAACGDDDDDVATDDTASGSASGSEAEAGEADLVTYCEKTAEIESIGEPDIDFENSSEEEIAAAAKAYANETLLPIAEEIVASAPPENEENVDILYAAVKEIAETGNVAAFETEEVEAASKASHAFDLESCDWNVVDVTATNYEFAGIDAELPAGTTSFELTNDGTELHELVIIRKNDDTTESFEELLELPQEEAMQKTTFHGVAFAEPGEEDVYTVVDLDAGEYIGICFIPVGTVDEETEAEGPPHFTQGMWTEFTVG